LLPILTEFLATFPEVDVQLGLQDRAVNLLEEHVDVALRIGMLADSSLIAVRVGEICRVVCASPAYLKARGTPKSPEDLSTHDCISYAAFLSPSTWTFKRDQTEYVVPVRSRLVVSNLESASDAARAGVGITTLFSYQATEFLKSGELIPLLQEFQSPPLPLSFVYSPARFMPVKLRAFLDFAVPRLRTRLGDLPKAIEPRQRRKAK
jgi:DNA-binding transcriptional LysR family regulator